MKDLTPRFLTPRFLWRLCMSLLLLSAAFAAWGLWATKGLAHQAREVRSQIDQLPPAVETKPPQAAASDFTTRLGPVQSSSRFVAELQRASASAGVSLASMTVSERAATADALGRQEFNVNLRGGYAPTKRVLADVLGRFATASISTLRMRKEAASGLVETAVVFSVWSAPLAAPAAVVR
jgi:hypothetical protein